MRIALVSQEYPPETAKGGIGAQAYLKAHALAARGHEVRVISRAPDGRRSERKDGAVHLLRVPGFEGRMPVYTEAADWLTYSAEVCAAILELHARHPLDLLEFPEWGAEGYLYLVNRTEWNHIPVAIQLHGPLVMFAHTMDWPEKESDFYRIGSQMEATCLRRADALYASSRCSADWCARHYGLDRSRIPVLHTGVDVQLFSPQPVPRDPRPTIVFVGKLVRNKGVVLLTQAACRLAQELMDLRLRLIGRCEEPLRRELLFTAQQAGCPHLLEFAGFLPREHLPTQLSTAHVFCAPSQYEGGPGFVYLEAMACGLPVIACAGSGASEVVEPDHNGLLVPPHDLDALHQALRRLLTNPAERDRMGACALAYARREADSRVCTARIAEFLESVAAAPAPGATP